jgi:YbgC/YbaW family acyl-CoA thioester hydrolase
VSEVFRTDVKVRFADVDDARVVYYPKYLDYCHVAFEEWMEAGFGKPYAEIFQQEHVGFPAVNVHVDYSAPSRFGDVLHVDVTCSRLGNKSATIRYRMTGAADGVLRADARVTVACVDMDSFRAMPHPDRFRVFFARHLERQEQE